MKLFTYLGALFLTALSFLSVSAETVIGENPNFASTKRANDVEYSVQRYQVYNSGQIGYYGFETDTYGSANGITMDLGDAINGTLLTTSSVVQRPPSFLRYRALQVSSDATITFSAPARGFGLYVIDNDYADATLNFTFSYADGSTETKQLQSSNVTNNTLQFFGFVSDRAMFSVKISGSALNDPDGVFIDNLTAINALTFRDPVLFSDFYSGITEACTQANTWRNGDNELTLVNDGTISCGGDGHKAGKVKLITLQISGDRHVGKGIEDTCWVSSSYRNAPVVTSSTYWRHDTVGGKMISTLYMRSYQSVWVSGRRGQYGISCRIHNPEDHNLKLTTSANRNYNDSY